MPGITRFSRPLLALSFLLGGATVASSQEATATSATESTVTLTAADRARYVGVYEMDTPDGPLAVHVYEEGEKLMGRPEHEDEPSALTPLGDHRFRPVLMQEAVLRFTVENDRAINFALEFQDERGTMMAFRRP